MRRTCGRCEEEKLKPGQGKPVRPEDKEAYGVSGRLGSMVNDNTALYARVGWANTKFSAAINGTGESDRDDTLTLGAGLETRFAAGSIRFEYNRADYADELKNNQFSLGYAFRF